MVDKLVTVGKGKDAYQVLMNLEDEEYVPPASADKPGADKSEASEPERVPTIKETMDRVGSDKELAQEALDWELSRDEEVQRSSLVTKLQAVLDNGKEEENA